MKKLKRQSKKYSLHKDTATCTTFSDVGALGLASKLTFGKYKNKTIKSVLGDDPMYLVWLMENNDKVRYNSKVMSSLSSFAISSSSDDADDDDDSNMAWSAFADTL